MADRLGNDYEIVNPNPDGPPFILDINHPYRFVFLDACQTGKTALWAEAFGIPGKMIAYNKIRNHLELASGGLGYELCGPDTPFVLVASGEPVYVGVFSSPVS